MLRWKAATGPTKRCAGAGAGVNKAGVKGTAMERIAIVGAGVMGQGIAEVFAAARVWKSVWEERSL